MFARTMGEREAAARETAWQCLFSAMRSDSECRIVITSLLDDVLPVFRGLVKQSTSLTTSDWESLNRQARRLDGRPRPQHSKSVVDAVNRWARRYSFPGCPFPRRLAVQILFDAECSADTGRAELVRLPWEATSCVATLLKLDDAHRLHVPLPTPAELRRGTPDTYRNRVLKQVREELDPLWHAARRLAEEGGTGPNRPPGLLDEFGVRDLRAFARHRFLGRTLDQLATKSDPPSALQYRFRKIENALALARRPAGRPVKY